MPRRPRLRAPGRRRWPCRGSTAGAARAHLPARRRGRRPVRVASRRGRGRGGRTPCWWPGWSVRRRASGSFGRGRVGRTQRAQHRARGTGAAGHGALNRGCVAVVAADVEAVAEVDRTGQLQRRDGRRLRAGGGGSGQGAGGGGGGGVRVGGGGGAGRPTPWARATSSRTSASMVGDRLELATRARPS